MAFGVDPSALASQQLSMIDDLLEALSRNDEIRDLFQRLTGVLCRIVPHDEAQLMLVGEDGSPLLYARTPEGASEGGAGRETMAMLDGDAPRVLDTVPGPDRGLQSGLIVPVRIDDRVVGRLALFSRRAQAYSHQDLVHAARVANCLALAVTHQRLADQVRNAAVERQRSAEIEGSAELLRTISGVLDIRTVFPRVSEIARKMLPHDALAMVFVDRDRHYVRQAASPDDFPDPPLVSDQGADAQGIRHRRPDDRGTARVRTCGRVHAGHRGRLPVVPRRAAPGP